MAKKRKVTAEMLANLAKGRAVLAAKKLGEAAPAAKKGWPMGVAPGMKKVSQPIKVNRVKNFEAEAPTINSSGTPTKITAALNKAPVLGKFDSQYRPGKVLFFSISPTHKVRLESYVVETKTISPQRSKEIRHGRMRFAEFKDHRYWADPKDVMSLRGGVEFQGMEGPLEGYGTAMIPMGYIEVFPLDDIVPLPEAVADKFLGIVSLSEMLSEGSPHQLTGEGFIACMYRNMKAQFQNQACMRKTREIDQLVQAHERYMATEPEKHVAVA